MFAVITNMMKTRTIFKRTIEAQIVQKVKNNKARPKFTGSYKKKKRVLLRAYKNVFKKTFEVEIPKIS